MCDKSKPILPTKASFCENIFSFALKFIFLSKLIKMTTTEFYRSAVQIAEEAGFEKPSVTTISGAYHGVIQHSCQLWINERFKRVTSGMQNNPNAALQAFKDAIEFENKEYSKEISDIELD